MSLSLQAVRRLRYRSLHWDNPVMTKEMRSRMRGGRAFTLMTVYVGLLGLGLLTTMAALWESGPSRGPIQDFGVIGRQTFALLSLLQLGLVSVLAPALTSGAITVEREQLTLDLLRLTRLSSSSILLGKLASSLSYLLLLVMSSLPLAGVCFLFGGVSPAEFLLTYGLTVAFGMLLGTVSLWWSVCCKRTSAATAAAYATAMLFLLAIPGYLAFVDAFRRSGMDSTSEGAWLFFFMSTLMGTGLIPALVAAVLTSMVAREFRPDWKPRIVTLVGFGLYSALFLIPLSAVFLSTVEYQPGSMNMLMALHPFMVMAALFGPDVGAGGSVFFRYAPLWAGGSLVLYLLLAAGMLVITTSRFHNARSG
jgi:hypothetical protein